MQAVSAVEGAFAWAVLGSFEGNDSLLGGWRQCVKLASGEARLPKRALVFDEGVGIATGRRGQHGECKCGCRRRRNAIRVGNEFEYDGPPARGQRRVSFRG